MNINLLNTDIQHFINKNLHTDLVKLILKGTSFSNVETKELTEQIEAKSKAEKKLPTWFSTQNIYYPNKLNIEQTSSETTAHYKSSLVSGNTLIDLTGGFGVDSFYFSKQIKSVVHCEINQHLSNIASLNFKQLGATNIDTINKNGIEYLTKTKKKYDWIYIDPSRRDDTKRKVFLLKDCLPNIPENLSTLFEYSNNILIKNSPILDLKSTIDELQYVKEIHIVAIHNEVKELLFILAKGYTENIQIKTINISKKEKQIFEFNFNDKVDSNYSISEAYVYEPNAAILKSGGFHQISHQFSLNKIHQHSHLYTSNKLIKFPGRIFKLITEIPYNKKQLLKLLTSKKANITTRNFPLSVAEIRKKMGIKDGGKTYLFFTTNLENKLTVLVCEKVSPLY